MKRITSLFMFWLLTCLACISASARTRDHTEEMSFAQKMNRLNYHYYLHDDSSYSHKMKEPLVVRLGRAQYWHGVKGVRRPSQLPGLTLSVNRTAIGGPDDGLIMPAISISYEISMDVVDEHILDQLLPFMFWEEGWYGEDEVIGVWASIPRKNVENRMGTIRIDLGQSTDSALFSNVLSDVSAFLGQLVTEEIDLKVNLIKPNKEHPLQGFRTLGSHEHSDWILAARESHILADIDLRDPDSVASAIRIIEADSSAGKIIITKRKHWPFDVEAHPLRIETAAVHPAIKFSLCEQILGIETLEEDSILAVGFEKVDNQLRLVFWLPSNTSKHTAERLIEFERAVLLKFQLHLTMEFIDNQRIFKANNQPSYDPGTRYPYKLLIMNKQYEHVHMIKTTKDFAELQHSEESPSGYHLSTLERSRLMFFHSASPKIYLNNPETFALVCTTPSNNLASLIKGLDQLVSRANAVFYALKMPHSLILIEPMEVIAEMHSGKGKHSRQQRSVTSKGPNVLSRFHFLLPNAIKISEMQGDNSMLSLIWRTVHQFIRSCGINEKVELITLDAFRLEEIKAHVAPVFTQELERSTDTIIKAVTGPSKADLTKARTARKQTPLTLAQLRERAKKREQENEAALRAEALAVQNEIERQNREREQELEKEMIRAEQFRIDKEAKLLRDAEEAKRLAEEQEARIKEKQAAIAAEAMKRKEAASLKAREKLSVSSRPAYVEPKVYQKTPRRRPNTPQLTSTLVSEVISSVLATETQSISAPSCGTVQEEPHKSSNDLSLQSEVCEELVHPRRQAKTVLFTPMHPLISLKIERRRLSSDVLNEFY